MIPFGSLRYLSTPASPRSSHGLWQAILTRYTQRRQQRRKLLLLLAACLCLTTPAAQAHLFSPLFEALKPKSSTPTNAPQDTVSASMAAQDSNDANEVNNQYLDPTIASESAPLANITLNNEGSAVADTPQKLAHINTLNGQAVANVPPILNEPSLYALLDAEFAAKRGNTKRALTLYKQQSFKEDATAVFERALKLSLNNEDVSASLDFAKAWQDENPDHVPAWFYVAHLALKAHDYALAGETLNRILRYDPRADLSEILIGIYPNTDSDKRELLAALQPIDSEQNASISVLKAGLLYQFNEAEVALSHINRALENQPDYVPFITLKADILRKIQPEVAVLSYINQARLRIPDSKSLYLYEIRYLLDLNQSEQAWTLLLEANKRFNEDAEITLLAALVSLDIEQYRSADQLLNRLAKNPLYLNQAYYYLGISAERQLRFEQAKYYLNGVMQEDLVLAARKKVVELELLNNNYAAAIFTLQKMRQQFEFFAPDSYVMQAEILLQQQQNTEALSLITLASRQYPDNELILFARAQLLDDVNDYVIKRALLNHLQALAPRNLSYQLSYAQLLLAHEPNAPQALALANAVVQIRYDDPRYDNELHLQALNILANNALTNENYAQVIEYLQTPYDVMPTLRSGVLLLRAYQGLGDNAQVETLLADLQQRFSFGQQNINDRVQLY